MTALRSALAPAFIALGLAACARRVVVVDTPREPQPARGENTRITLGVPPGHVRATASNGRHPPAP